MASPSDGRPADDHPDDHHHHHHHQQGVENGRCPANANPLFTQWLAEWKEEAFRRGRKSYHSFAKALRTLKKTPKRFETGNDCRKLKYFGRKICTRLDDRLKEHNEEKDTDDPTPEEPPKQKTRYCPPCRSGAFAIILTLYRQSLDPDYKGFMTKMEVIVTGQYLTDRSFIIPDPNTGHTAWTAMGSLVRRMLVIKERHPARYHLSEDGYRLAGQLDELERGDERCPVLDPEYEDGQN